MTFLTRLKETRAKSPHLILPAAFATVIAIGTILLLLPCAQSQGFSELPFIVKFIDVLFTATSATCVTGLTTVTVCESFSSFGQCVILAMIQFGGLGIMTFASFFILVAGRKLSSRDETISSLSSGGSANYSFTGLLLLTFIFTIAVEVIGASILTHRFQNYYNYSFNKALFFGIFHAVSAFCNAGISLFDNSLCNFPSDITFSATITSLMWLGGLGFLVIGNILHIRFWDKDLSTRGRVNLQSRIALNTSLILTLVFFALFTITEWHHSLEGMETADKFVSSVFQSVTCRTSGFNMVDMTRLSMPIRFLTIVMIFIGGAPGSTAGGIKTTTVAVLLLTMKAFTRGQSETVFRKRTIPESTVREALAICILTLLFISLTFGLLLLTETHAEADPFNILFETFSAYGTSGLSLGQTKFLSLPGRLIIILAMYVGRLGPLTIALCAGGGNRSQLRIRYPEENVAVG